MKNNVIQLCILKCIVRSEVITDTLKLMVLSYLFFQLCWDFDYFRLCADIENGSIDYNNYDFENIQYPRPVGDETDDKKE